MKVKVKEPFESRKIKGKMIPPGLHDLADDWAKELIDSGIAEACEFKMEYSPEKETRIAVEPKKEKRKTKKIK